MTNQNAGDRSDSTTSSAEVADEVVEAEVVTNEADETPAPEATSSEPEVVEERDYLDDLRRLQAEFENFRKRTSREQTALASRANASLVESLLPVVDDFELSMLAAGQTQDFEKMLQGVEMVYAKLREVLEKAGLERIQAKGKPFDPAIHEAVMEGEGEGEEQFVEEEFRSGYRFSGTVLRPSMVKVIRK